MRTEEGHKTATTELRRAILGQSVDRVELYATGIRLYFAGVGEQLFLEERPGLLSASDKLCSGIEDWMLLCTKSVVGVEVIKSGKLTLFLNDGMKIACPYDFTRDEDFGWSLACGSRKQLLNVASFEAGEGFSFERTTL